MSKAFIVYSSNLHVPYMNDVLSVVESVLHDMDIEPRYLTDGYHPGLRFIPKMLQQNVEDSDFAIVILDGLRPNVAYELGLFHMRGVDIIPLKRSSAKFAIKSAYYNQEIEKNDPKLAFGDIRYKKAAFKHLKEPPLDIGVFLSDFQGLEEERFDTLDDTEEFNSLGKRLRDRITKIIPHLIARTGPGFKQIHLSYPDLDQNILDESLTLLSLFSILGLRRNFKGDTTFQQMRDDFINLFSLKSVSFEDVSFIFETLLKNEENILRNFGRYITIDSERLINESFQFLIETNQFSKYYLKIIQSENPTLIRRFMERLSSGEYLKVENIKSIGRYIFGRSKLFPDISIFQNREKAELFSKTAYRFPSKAIDLLQSWFGSIDPPQIEKMFPLTSCLINPGVQVEPILWFLSKISEYDEYFGPSMEILYKFSLPIIVNEEEIKNHIHSASLHLALHRFLEQCYPFQGEVKLKKRWRYIDAIKVVESLPLQYQEASIELKFRAIKNFLESQWSVAKSYQNGHVQIRHFQIQNMTDYSDLEEFRKQAFYTIMKWVKSTETLYSDDKRFYSYLIDNLSKWIRYFPWEEIKLFLENCFKRDILYKNTFRNHIEYIRKYDSWKSSYSDENLASILTFDDNLEISLPPEEYFRKYLQMFRIQEIRESLILKMESISNHQKETIKKLLIQENFSGSYSFGKNIAENSTKNDLIQKIEDYREIVEKTTLSHVSKFFCGMMHGLYCMDENLWKLKIEEFWSIDSFSKYRQSFLYAGSIMSQFIWSKFQQLFESDEISQNDMLKVILDIRIPDTIPNVQIKKVVKKCITKIGDIPQNILHNNTNWSIDDPLSESYSLLEEIFKKFNSLLEEESANWILVNFLPHASYLLSRISDSNFLVELGRLSPVSFTKWLLIGFSISELEGDSFLIRASEYFLPKLYELTLKLFSLPKEEELMMKIHHISFQFEILGECRFLLKFNETQIETLYTLNSLKLGHLIGRVIKMIKIDEPFPTNFQSVIKRHQEDDKFNLKIFKSFSSGVRNFSGNHYEQAFSADFQRIIIWKELSNEPLMFKWLEDLYKYLESYKQRFKESWREKEVN